MCETRRNKRRRTACRPPPTAISISSVTTFSSPLPASCSPRQASGAAPTLPRLPAKPPPPHNNRRRPSLLSRWLLKLRKPETISSTVSTTSMFPTSHPFHNSHSSDRCTRELWRWRSLHLFYDSIPCIISHTEYKFRKNLPNLPRRWACTYERINELTNQGATGQRYGAPK